MIIVEFKPGQRRSLQASEKNDYLLVNWRISSHSHVWRPPTDVYERDDEIVVRVEIAGMAEDGFAISLDQDVLTIRGVRPDLNERRAYYMMEINFGEFLSAIDIPMPVDPERVRAEYLNGFLWIFLPKAQPRVIKIKDNE
jgi:HSP20 family molecular chaperone IbpA